MVGIGLSILLFAKRHHIKTIGNGVLGFGFVFLAIRIMSEALAPLQQSALFKDVLIALVGAPFTGIAIAAAFTALVHSSAATIGIALARAVHGLVPLEGAIHIVLGANIGTCSTALMASMRAPAEARRVAWAHTIFKVLGVLLMLPFLPLFERLVSGTGTELSRQIANAHTLFNVGVTVLFLPFAALLARLIAALVPDDRGGEGIFRAKYLDEHMLDTPALALGQATREALRMADLVSEMLTKTIDTFAGEDPELIEFIAEKDNQVDVLDRDVKHYVTKLSQQSLTDEQRKREIEILSFVNNMENIGDIVDRNLMELAKKRLNKGARFSGPGMQEITLLHKKVLQNLELAIAAFASTDAALAQQVLERKLEISQTERRFRQAHIQRLHDGYRESIDTSEIHLDVITNLKRINSHITAIAYPVIESAS
jgi:phosphate:Na+ symporter